MMKKHIAFLVAAVMLILAACQPSQQGQPETQPATTAPVETTTTLTETTQAVETTVPPTTVPPTESTSPIETKPLNYTEINDYNNEIWECVVYREGRYDNRGWNLDNCVNGKLYVFNLKTGEPILICEDEVQPGLGESTAEFVFYITKNNPRQVICSTPDGTEQFVCYEAQYADITDITTIAPIGTIGILEGDQYLIQYDFEKDTFQLLLDYKYISSFYLGILDHARVVEFKDENGKYWVYYLDTKQFEESW